MHRITCGEFRESTATRRDMLRSLTSLLALCAVLASFTFVPVASHAAANCGDGVLDANEECDGGSGGLFIDGNPGSDTCATGSRCYYESTCCKFNCQYVGTPGAPCHDGDNCTGPDTCDQVGVCHGGPNAADDTPCDDGLFCTGVESCRDGRCVSATGDPCPGTACNQCQEETETCVNPAGSPCSSGDTCVTGGSCDGAGLCVGGVFNNAPCDDGLYCNGSDACDGGACRLHSGDPCPGGDGDADCSESCNETTDTCAGNDFDGAACSDGLFCNGPDDTCVAGACLGTGQQGCDDDNSCTNDACDEGGDSCTHTTIGDGLACSDADPCSLDDVCSGGQCIGTPPLLEDLCPWTVVLREQERKDMIKTYAQVSIEGDVCGGTIKLDGETRVTSDLVSDEAEGDDQLYLAADVMVGEDIVSAGAGATANPSLSFLPHLVPDTVTLAPFSLVAKSDGTGVYDLTGTHELAGRCHAARNAYEEARSRLDALEQTSTFPAVKLGPGETATIPATVAGGLNVVDVTGSIKVGDGAVLELDGGGDPNTVMILRISNRMRMLVLSSLNLTNGLLPENVIVYIQGKKCLFNTLSSGAGTVLCSPGRIVARQGVAWVGALFGDGKFLSAGQDAVFIYRPFQGF
jgi:hypothetical protein